MVRILGLVAILSGLAVAAIGALTTVQIYQHLPALCPDDPACEGAQGAVWIGLFAVLVGCITVVAGVMIRRHARRLQTQANPDRDTSA